MLNCIVDMLNAQGTFVVSTPVRRRGALSDRPTWDFHEREWSTAEFVSLLHLYFDDVKVYGQRWALRQNYGPIHLGKSVVKKLIRRFEEDCSFIDRLEFDIIEQGTLPTFWIDPNPLHTVCVCRGPHRASDANLLKKLTYG